MCKQLKIHFAPCRLMPTSKPYHAAQEGAFEVVKNAKAADIIWNWNWDSPYQGTLISDKPVINGACWNIAKDFIDKAFTMVSGFSTEAEGRWAVEKPINTNGFKDCKLVDLARHPRRLHCFYQRPLFDLKQEGEMQMDELRFVIMGGVPVMIIVKHKVFTREYIPGRVVDFTFDLIEDPRGYDWLSKFCHLLNIDYAEIDVIRYLHEFYIIDVNTTPGDTIFKNKDHATKAAELRGMYIDLLADYLKKFLQT